MSTETILTREELAAIYPESDGEPMGDSTDHVAWINLIFENIEELYVNEPDVFVANNLLWYPVEGDPKIRIAPDVMVVFGRPKGSRGSWLQWIEADTPPQVVVEVRSPGNTAAEMAHKHAFYERYGVAEYYLYDYPRGRLSGWRRDATGVLAPIPRMKGWVSPLLRIRFETGRGELQLFFPDGRPFLARQQLAEQRNREAELRRAAEARAQQTESRVAQLEARLRDIEAQLARVAEEREAEKRQAALEIERLRKLMDQASRGSTEE